MIDRYKLLELRQKHGMSQEALGKAIGLNGSYIGDIEQGRRTTVTTATLCKLADTLHCSADELLGRLYKAYV
jgi:transcriptional regulator with XRE-family HTH domain